MIMMSAIDRKITACAVAQLMPSIIQGARLGFVSNRTMTQTQFLLLIVIQARGACAMGALASCMNVRLPTMSGVVARLVKARYLKRIPNLNDRRQVFVGLTPKGEAFIKQFRGIIASRWEDVLKALSPKEVGDFYHTIVKLNRSLNVRG